MIAVHRLLLLLSHRAWLLFTHRLLLLLSHWAWLLFTGCCYCCHIEHDCCSQAVVTTITLSMIAVHRLLLLLSHWAWLLFTCCCYCCHIEHDCCSQAVVTVVTFHFVCLWLTDNIHITQSVQCNITQKFRVIPKFAVANLRTAFSNTASEHTACL